MVDNASTDGSLEFVRKNFPSVNCIQSKTNMGFAGGNNLGLLYCKGAFIFFLNNDTRLEAGALGILANSILKFERHRVFSCLMLNYSNPELVDAAGDNFYWGGFISTFSRYPAMKFKSPREVTAACAGAAVYSKELLVQLGGFDEDFFLLFEDVDLSLRARHHGESILFLPDVHVFHKGSATIGGTRTSIYIYFGNRNFLPLYIKNFPFVTLLKCLPGILLMLGIRVFNTIKSGHLRILVRSFRDSILMIPGTLKKRKVVQRESKLSRKEFEKSLRHGWFQERLAFKRGYFKTYF